MTEPLVSVLIPTYNGERFLRPALRSALTQSHRNLEVIVGDDASTDSTAQILAAVAATDPRVRVIRHEHNLGAYENPLYLMREARGEYVKFLLHDDVLASECIRTLVRGMESAPGVSLAFSRRSLIDEDGRPVPGHEFPALSDRPGLLDGIELGDSALEICSNVIGEFTTILYRRSDIDLDGVWQVDGRRLDVVTDFKVALQLLARGSAWYDPRVLSRFRRHATQNSFHPAFVSRAVRDWPKLLDWAVRQGFLADEARQRRAFARALLIAAGRVDELVDGPDHGPGLEGVLLATARLVELDARVSGDSRGGLQGRAHEPALLTRLTQELDVWTRTWPIALAAPAADTGALDRDAVNATVQALRELSATGIAENLVLAVPERLLDDAVPLVEAALAAGTDLDVELVPADAPQTLFRDPWLAVAPRGSHWPDGHATAIWTVPNR